jgi:uncharacterized membrane protein YphA (DoxX/SURF4 family)
MEIFVSIIQLIIALTILNVWLLRRNRATPYRGGNASNLIEEFKTYGLPEWSVYVVGGFKVLLALFLFVGLWAPTATKIGSIGLAVFMLGAFVMHVRVNDRIKRALPSLIVLILCLFVGLKSTGYL